MGTKSTPSEQYNGRAPSETSGSDQIQAEGRVGYFFSAFPEFAQPFLPEIAILYNILSHL